MARPSFDEVRKILQSAPVTGENLHATVEKIEQEFASTSAGQEAFYLHKVETEYVSNYANFIAHFITGPAGQKGIDTVIASLKKVPKPDKSLIRTLAKLSKKMSRMHLADWPEWQHYETLRQNIPQLQLSPDMHTFVLQFRHLKELALKYPQTLAAKTISARKTKKTPWMIKLEEFEMVLYLWKYLLTHLYRRDQESKATEIIGDHFLQSLPNVRALFAREMKIPQDKIDAEFRKCLPLDREDDNMTNIRTLAQTVAREGRKNIFVRILLFAGNANRAKAFQNQFGKKGAVKTGIKTIHGKNITFADQVAQIVMNMQQVQTEQKVEAAARQELLDLVQKTVRDLQKDIVWFQQQVKTVIQKRVSYLKKKHSKELAHLTKIENQMAVLNKEVLFAATSQEDIVRRLAQVSQARKDNLLRASDIMAIKQARRLFVFRMRGTMMPEEVEARLKKLMDEKPSPMVVQAINNIRAIFDALQNGQITKEQFQANYVGLQKYIHQLDDQLRQIPQNLLHADNVLANLFNDWKDMSRVLEVDVPELGRMSSRTSREIKGIEPERHDVHPEHPAQRLEEPKKEDTSKGKKEEVSGVRPLPGKVAGETPGSRNVA